MNKLDREAILRRRAAFIAAALVGLTTTEARAEGGSSADEGGGGAGGEAAGGGGGEGGAPQPCLSMAKNDCDCSLAGQADDSNAVGALVALAVAGARRRRKPAANKA